MSEGRRQSAFAKRAKKSSGLSRNEHHSSSTRAPSTPSKNSDNTHLPPSSPFFSGRSPSILDGPVTLPIQLTFSQLRPIAYRIFSKKHGLNLKTSGLEALAEFIGRKFGLDWRGSAAQRFMDDVAKLWKQEDRGLFIERDQLQEIIREVLDLSQSMASRNNTIDPNSNAISRQATLLNLFNNNNSNENSGPRTAQRNDTVTDLSNPIESNDSFHIPQQNYDQSTIELIDTNIIAAKLAKQTDINWKDYYKVIPSFTQPPYEYNPAHKQFELKTHITSFLAPVSSRVSYFLNRYHLIYDSLIRQELFYSTKYYSNSLTSITQEENNQVITPINNLLGRDGKAFIIFGLLTVGTNGKYWIQDSTGKIEIDIESHALPAPGSYYTPGCLVITDGIVNRSKFIVTTLGPPACETRQSVRENFGFIDFLGIHAPPSSSSNSSKQNHATKSIRVDRALEKKLFIKESVHSDHRIYILGCNIYLDKLKTLDSLRKLFTRLKAEILLDSLVPITFILMGPFLSKPFQPNGSSSPYKDGMDALAQILSEYPELFRNGANLLLVPGDGDPWEATFSAGAPTTWPMKGVPATFTNRILRAAPNTTLPSNPCRIAYLSQEFLIVRDDAGSRLRRNQIFFPALERRLNGFDEDSMDIDLDQSRGGHENDIQELSRSSVGRESRKNGLIEEYEETPSRKQAANGRKNINAEIVDLEDDLEQIVLDTRTDKRTQNLVSQNKKNQELLKERSKLLSTPKEHVDPDVAEARRIVKTLLDQATLSPFPLSVRPVAWDYSHALSLSPLPTMV